MLSAERMTERIAGLMARYTSRPSAPQAAIVSAWLDDLEDLTEEEVDAGIKAHCRDAQEGRFWPTTAAIRGHVVRLREVGQRALQGPTLSPEEEWRHVVRTAAGVGSYRVEDARRLLGEDLWRAIGEGHGYAALCRMTQEEIPSERARFCALRQTQRAREREDATLKPILRLIEGIGEPKALSSPATLRLVGH